MTGETPRKTRGSLIGMVNEREFGVSFLEANITDNEEEGSSTLQARLDNIPPSVGEWVHTISPALISSFIIILSLTKKWKQQSSFLAHGPDLM